MQRNNYEENAREFFNALEQPKSMLLGINYFLLFHLQRRKIILFEDFFDFIKNKSNNLEATDFANFKNKTPDNKDPFLTIAFLQELGLKDENIDHAMINNEKIQRVVKSLISFLSDEAKMKKIGRSYALYFHLRVLGIKDSLQDIKDKLEKTPANMKWSDTHRMNPKDAEQGLRDWPINIASYSLDDDKTSIFTNLHASCGFFDDNHFTTTEFELSKNQKAAGFFELFFKEKKNFRHIVALGYTDNEITPKKNPDFYNYFQPPGNSDQFEIVKTVENNQWIYTVQSKQDLNQLLTGYLQFNLIITKEDKKNKTTFTKELDLYQMLTKDGAEPTFDDESLQKICTLLRGACKNNEDILVHCHAGIGRTGMIIASQDDVFEYIFADNIFQNIIARLTKFIQSLRESRPGLIAEPNQIYQIIYYALHYRELLNPTMEKTESFSKSSHGFHQPAPQEKTITTAPTAKAKMF